MMDTKVPEGDIPDDDDFLSVQEFLNADSFSTDVTLEMLEMMVDYAEEKTILHQMVFSTLRRVRDQMISYELKAVTDAEFAKMLESAVGTNVELLTQVLSVIADNAEALSKE